MWKHKHLKSYSEKKTTALQLETSRLFTEKVIKK